LPKVVELSYDLLAGLPYERATQPWISDALMFMSRNAGLFMACSSAAFCFPLISGEVANQAF
jgi:hypothetical protein